MQVICALKLPKSQWFVNLCVKCSYSLLYQFVLMLKGFSVLLKSKFEPHFHLPFSFFHWFPLFWYLNSCFLQLNLKLKIFVMFTHLDSFLPASHRGLCSKGPLMESRLDLSMSYILIQIDIYNLIYSSVGRALDF